MATLLMPKEEAAKALKEEYGVDLDWHSFGDYIDKCNANGMAGNRGMPFVRGRACRERIRMAGREKEADPS